MFAIEQNASHCINYIDLPNCRHIFLLAIDAGWVLIRNKKSGIDRIGNLPIHTKATDLHMNDSPINERNPLQEEMDHASFGVEESDLAATMGKNAAEFFRIFDHHLYVAILGPDRRMVAISKKLRDSFNLSQDVIWHLSDFIAPAPEHKTHMDDIWRTIAQDGIWGGDVCHRSARGATSWLSAAIIPCKDDSGEKCTYIAIFTDITARVENEAALRVSRNDLRALANHMDFSQECDRKRIAREIHDELGQHLLALKMDLFGLQMSSALVQPRVARDTSALMRSVDETMIHVKRIINDLRPIALDAGLAEAVRICAASFTRRHKVPCNLSLSDATVELNEVAVTTLYRVLQESLVNIGRHAQARSVDIALLCSRNAISIEIDDDGIGMVPSHHNRRKTFGLLGMKERVEMLGGTLTVTSQIGAGTKVIASMPRK